MKKSSINLICVITCVLGFVVSSSVHATSSSSMREHWKPKTLLSHLFFEEVSLSAEQPVDGVSFSGDLAFIGLHYITPENGFFRWPNGIEANYTKIFLYDQKKKSSSLWYLIKASMSGESLLRVPGVYVSHEDGSVRGTLTATMLDAQVRGACHFQLAITLQKLEDNGSWSVVARRAVNLDTIGISGFSGFTVELNTNVPIGTVVYLDATLQRSTDRACSGWPEDAPIYLGLSNVRIASQLCMPNEDEPGQCL